MRTIQRTAAGGAAAVLLALGTGTPGASAVDEPIEVGRLTVIRTEYGDALADRDGNALYVFGADGRDENACADRRCARRWPAALAGGGVERPDEVTARLGATGTAQPGTRGERQLTLNGRPVYYYAQDTAPGDARGHGAMPGGEDSVWYLVGTDGESLRVPGGGPTDDGDDGYSR